MSGSRIRSKTNTTSSAVTGCPSWNVAPSRSVNLQDVPPEVFRRLGRESRVGLTRDGVRVEQPFVDVVVAAVQKAEAVWVGSQLPSFP